MADVLNDLLARHKDTRSTSPPPTSTSVASRSCVKGSDEGLEQLLGLVESLSQKIASIDQSGFLDASILGEVVHPRNFNTLRRIEEEDGKVVEEQEQFAELVSSEFLLQNLKNLLDAGMRRMLEDLPDGIHSGLARVGAKGVFFYFTAPGSGTGSQASGRSSRQHF